MEGRSDHPPASPRDFLYRVSGWTIVPAADLARLKSHGREVVVLEAGHARFFATRRYLVYGRPV